LGHNTYSTFKARYAIEEKICTLPTGILQNKLLRATGNGRVNIDGHVYSVADLDRKTTLEQLDKRNVWYDRFPKITGYKNEEELRDRIAKHSFRVTLADCYDLPSKMYSSREVELTADQKRIYKDLKEKATAELIEEEETTGHVTALNVISRMIRLHQVLCGHTRDELNVLHEIKEKRTGELIDLLREIEGKVVIWASYDYNIKGITSALEKEYGEGSVARFWGGNAKTREAEEGMFQDDPKCRFMVGTPSAGGRGRLWAVADTVIYFSNTNNLEFRSQSEERTQAINKKTSVQYIDLIAPGTVDERIIEALRAKIDMAATISGDSWRKWLI
jgi:SNF2 family DNA or RNA helicase